MFQEIRHRTNGIEIGAFYPRKWRTNLSRLIISQNLGGFGRILEQMEVQSVPEHSKSDAETTEIYDPSKNDAE